MTPTLRTAEGEERYAKAPKKKIDELDYQTFEGMRLIENGFEYDLCHQDGMVPMANPGESFMEWWFQAGIAIRDGKVPFNQFIFNITGQSQPQVPHGHFVNFNKDHIKFLRFCITNRKKIEELLNYG